MNTEQKNIETCLPESILAEVASVPTDPQFVSLVEESFDPLQQQAVQQAGSDAYKEVVKSHQPYTFTSQVAQMKSNLILLLRRLWRVPFGSGTLRSLSDMWEHYISRLSGNETYGIPSRLSQLTDLPSAPLLVADRKISGVPEAEDGMSMARILCDSAVGGEITQLLDETKGWTMNRTIPSLFGTLTKIKLGCSVINEIQISTSAELIMDELKTTNRTGTWHAVFNYDGEKLSFPNLETINGNSNSTGTFAQGNYKELYIPKVTRIYDAPGNHGCFLGCYQGRDSRYLRKLVVGKLTSFSWNFGGYYNTGYDSNLTDFIHFEIGQDTAISLNCAKWNPTNALDASSTDLIEEGSTAHPTWNNLQQFLQNFRSFIVLRLANRNTTTALTLTLSANVYNAVTGANSGWASLHTLADLGITDNDLTDLETELGITSATIYASWLDTYTGANGIHWDINKAN